MKRSCLLNYQLALLLGGLILCSCQTSRYSGGFTYKSKDPGMDIGSSGKVPKQEEDSRKSEAGNPIMPASQQDAKRVEEYLQSQHVSLSSGDREKISSISALVRNEYKRQIAERQWKGDASPVRTKEVIGNVARQMQAKGMVPDLSERKLKRMERLGDRLDKRMNSHSRAGFLGEGIDLFFAIVALAGLAVALIFGTFIGVLIFLVFGGIWLYRKLVTH